MKKAFPCLEIKNVNAGYDDTAVLQNISFDVREQETFGLIGGNGVGKTTLIKCIIGLREPLAGEILLFGRSHLDQTAKMQLCYLPERFEPPWFLSGYEFLDFSARLYNRRIARDEIDSAADRLVLDLDALPRRVNTYSKGMRQKLGLLGCFVTGCKLMILDEPMSGLDPIARTHVKDMLLEEKAKGTTIFICSHILADMEEICDRVAVLHNKSLADIDDPENVIKKTKSDNLERAYLTYVQRP